jgi:hypothetical protein
LRLDNANELLRCTEEEPFLVKVIARKLKVEIIKDVVDFHCLVDLLAELGNDYWNFLDVLLGLSQFLDVLRRTANALINFVELS